MHIRNTVAVSQVICVLCGQSGAGLLSELQRLTG